MSTVAVMALGTSATASEIGGITVPVISGEVELTFGENVSGDWAGDMALDLNVNAGTSPVFLDLGFVANDGTTVELDTWVVGTLYNGSGIKVGNDIGTWVGAEGEQTLADPVMGSGVAVSLSGATLALGLTDWKSDITDLENIRASYSMGISGINVTAAGDWNMNTENAMLGAEASGIDVGPVDLGAAVTYDMDASVFGFEGFTDIMGVTAYVNGDQDDVFQNVGGSYTKSFFGAGIETGLNYNVDSTEIVPTVSVAFAF